MSKRSIEIKVRLNKKEMETLNKRVKKSGLSREGYLRHLINGSVPREAPPPDFYAMMRELYRIGNSLNQIACKTNTLDDSKKALIREIFWLMNTLTAQTETKTETVVTQTVDGHGNVVETTTTVTKVYLHITVAHKSADEMADHYGFNNEQRAQLSE